MTTKKRKPAEGIKSVYLSFDQCPHGHGGKAISINVSEGGGGHGDRLTGGKCCGSWTTSAMFPIRDQEGLDDILRRIKSYRSELPKRSAS